MGRKYIIGLDIGTTKVCAVVARVEDGIAEAVGMGVAPSIGLRKGVVVDIDMTTDAIRAAVAEAEASSGIEIKAAYVGVTGSHIECLKSYGAAGIKGSEVTREDIDRVMDSASALYVPLDREVLHVLPTDFVIDGHGGIVRPMGMSGSRIEANVRVITASHSAVENVLKCCRRAGVEVVAAVFEPIASARAVARGDELDAGVAVVDIGGGASGVAVYKDGGLVHASALPVGGNHLTNDIAIGLKVSQKEAERIKKEHGYAVGADEQGELIEVKLMNDEVRQVPRHYLKEIIRPRCEEVLKVIRQSVHNSSNLLGPSSVVLTGGAALLPGLDRIAEAVFGLPARVGTPSRLSGPEALRNAAFSTGAGLVLWGYEAEKSSREGVFDEIVRKTKNLLEVRNWGILKKSRRAEPRG